MEQFGAGSRTECVELIPESALEFVGSHCRRVRRDTVGFIRRWRCACSALLGSP